MRRNYRCRIITDIKICDINTLVLENEKLRITILLDKGGDIIEFLYKPRDIDFMWCSPVDLHQPSKYISTTGSSMHNYLDQNFGGWQEIFPNGGSENIYKGCVIGMHGEASTIPWQYHIIKDTAEEIVVKLSVKTIRSPFYLEKFLSLKSGVAKLFIDEKMTNLANEKMELMWGHHPTLGEGFLDESCVIKISAKKVFTYGETKDFDTQRLSPNSEYNWPNAKDCKGKDIDLSLMLSKDANIADMLYFKDFDKEASYEIINYNKKISFNVSWDSNVMPYAWMWLVAGGSYGYPWYGNTYSLAIEPWSSYPSLGLKEAINNKSALRLNAKQSYDFSMCIGVNEI